MSSPVSFASNSGHGNWRKGTTGKEIEAFSTQQLRRPERTSTSAAIASHCSASRTSAWTAIAVPDLADRRDHFSRGRLLWK